MSEFLSSHSWVAVDTETTGLNPWKHEIIEIGAVRFNLEGIQEELQVLVKPTSKIDPKSRAVHNISNEELDEHGVSKKDAAIKFLSFIKDGDLVFHNAWFDVFFLTVLLEEQGVTLPDNIFLDNLLLSRKYFQERESHALVAIRDLLNIDTGVAHRALADAKATAMSFLDTLIKKGSHVDSKKKYYGFLKFHQKFNRFKMTLPKNLEEIELYFSKKIKSKQFLRVKFVNKERRVQTLNVRPIELMVFNQNVFIKAEELLLDTILIPLAGAVIYDKELGNISFIK